MSVTVTGTYDGTVIRLDGPEPDAPSGGFLDTAMSLQVSGPRDWAINFEKYLHGPLASDE